jgi:hypothetical protein
VTVFGNPSTRRSDRSPARPLSQERVFCCPGPLRRRLTPLLAALFALLLVVQPVLAQQPATPVVDTAALQRAVDWLVSQQADDGGYIGFSGESDAGATVDAVLALAAAREGGIDVDLEPALDFLSAEDHGLVYAQTGAGQAAKLVMAVVAAGGDPRDVAGVDPLSLAMAVNDDTGFYGSGAFDHSLAMIAIAAAGEEVPDEAVSRLVDAQQDNGSWAFDGSELEGSGDSNTTAIAIQAMAVAGEGSGRDVQQALDWLKSVQDAGGGFTYQPTDGAAPDANSTGIVVQGLIAAGQDPSSGEWKNAMGALLAFQNESGAFRYMDDPPDDNLFATVQAIPAVAGVAFPVIADSGIATPIAA